MALLTQPSVREPVQQESRTRRDVLKIATPVAAAAAAIGWLPFFAHPTGPDEGGYLLIASQWRHGTSLYGNYWVDRPPLLILIHQLAGQLGGTIALRGIGLLAVLVSVCLASAISRTAARTNRGTSTVSLVAPVVIAAAFLTTSLFGTTTVAGELLSVPLVLAGILALIRGGVAGTRSAEALWTIVAGAAASAAVMVKQNSIDVFVFTAVALLVQAAAGGRARVVRALGLFAAGAAVSGTALLTFAALRGTRPAGLWDALVTFRLDAASLIHQSATIANSERLSTLLHSAVVSFAPILIAILALLVSRAPTAASTPRLTAGADASRPAAPDLRWPAVLMLIWEATTVAAGGSYWLHYLLVLVPGMVVLAAAAAQRPPALRKSLAAVLTAVVASGGIATVQAARGPLGSASDAHVISYLKAHDSPGDTAVVAFGHPNILWDTHLSSPYQQLWSLPVRVRDSHLDDFIRVVTSSDAPTWVIVPGPSLDSWGLDATRADQLLIARYHRVTKEGRYYIWHIDRPGRTRRNSPDH